MDDTRKQLLRSWAAFNDLALEAHGSDEAVAARRKANFLADTLGDFSESDWGVIRQAQRGYLTEGAA